MVQQEQLAHLVHMAKVLLGVEPTGTGLVLEVDMESCLESVYQIREQDGRALLQPVPQSTFLFL